MTTIAVINQKGGVGKTTTTANLGAALVQNNKRVCLMDLDPQAHLTLTLGVEPGAGPGAYELLTGSTTLADTVVEVKPGLTLIPSSIDLAAAEVELVSTVGREQILRDLLANQQNNYDFVMIDCPPSLGLLTLNALCAAQEVIIPLQPHFLALQGLGKLLETISLVHKRINPALKVCGIVLCMYETGTRLASEVVADLETFLTQSRGTNQPWSQASILQTVIRRNVKLAECPSHGASIFDYEPASNGARDYAMLAEEFLGLFEPDQQEQPSQAVQLPPAPEPQSPSQTPPEATEQTTLPTPPQTATPQGDGLQDAHEE